MGCKLRLLSHNYTIGVATVALVKVVKVQSLTVKGLESRG